MRLSKLKVYDPPMCCSSGVCGPTVDPELVRFSTDLEWLKKQGVEVDRFNLSSHPAEFVQEQVVKEALKYEGNACLPLVVLDGSIVSRCVYPSRVELMAFTGITGDVKDEAAAVLEPPASFIREDADTAACGPRCNCAPTSTRKPSKVIAGLIILLAAGSILAYKALNNNQDASKNTDTKSASTFDLTPPAPTRVPGMRTGSSESSSPEKARQSAMRGNRPNRIKRPPSESSTGGKKMGDNLESLNALNEVAMDHDAVFIYIPGRGTELASSKTNAAVSAAQKTLKSNKISLGLFTLPTSSPDYTSLAAQVKAPAVLIASKGKGMAAVSGEVTELKLLQAFVSCSSAGGCGPSSGGCGPSTPGCK